MPFPALKNIFFNVDIADIDFVKDSLSCASRVHNMLTTVMMHVVVDTVKLQTTLNHI